MNVNATPAFAAYLAGNGGPTTADPNARERPDYGLSASFDGAVSDLVLTVRAARRNVAVSGSATFCSSRAGGGSGCDASLLFWACWSRSGWCWQVEVIIEDGALYLVPCRSPHTLPALAPAKAHRYRAAVTEGNSPEV